MPPKGKTPEDGACDAKTAVPTGTRVLDGEGLTARWNPPGVFHPGARFTRGRGGEPPLTLRRLHDAEHTRSPGGNDPPGV